MEDQSLKDYLLEDLSISYWLKEALNALDDRDPVDALRDAEILKSFCEKKLKRVSKKAEETAKYRIWMQSAVK